MTRHAAVVALALLCACRGGGASEARPPAGPSSAQVPAGAGKPDGVGTAVGLMRGMPAFAVVMDDPRLASAREREEAHDDAAAVREVERAHAGASLDAARSCEWSYLAGRLHLAAGEPTEAAAAFDRAASEGVTPCPLAPYARLREAQALLRSGRSDEAAVCARAVGEDVPARDEARLALADALAQRGDRAGAIPIWRNALAVSPHGVRWVDLSMELARALLDGVEGPPVSHAQEALDLTTRVVVDAPAVAEKLDAAGLRDRAAVALGVRAPPQLTPEERARQAQAWLDATQSKQAREAAQAVLEAVPKGDKRHHEAACSAGIVRAQATPRGKAEEAAAAWAVAIARCEGEEGLVTALFSGARASVSAKRNAEALARFDRVEKLFPTHRLADDARFRAALVVGDEGDEARSEVMLSSLVDTYPDGDMRGEALFRIALAKLEQRDLEGARVALDRLRDIEPDDPTRGSAARASYFRARVAELAGSAEEAKNRYAAIVTDNPLGYYMLLAYARLRAADDGLARSTLAAAVARETASPFLTRAHPELEGPVFERFRCLLEVGEIDAARREAGAGGLVAEGVDSEVLWTIGWLYDRAGAPEFGHAFARARLVDYRAHWPAGRWRLAWEVAFPRAWDAIVVRESESTSIPAPLTWAIMREESAFNQDARSVASAIGLMQLLVGTARQVARDTQLPWDEQALHRPEVSIALGARFLASLRVSFSARPALAIAAYNGGSGAVRRWLADRGTGDFDVFVERIPYDETRGYIKRVLATEAAYAYLYDPAALDELLTLPARGGWGTSAAP